MQKRLCISEKSSTFVACYDERRESKHMDAPGAAYRDRASRMAADGVGLPITNHKSQITNGRNNIVPAWYAADVPLLYPLPRRDEPGAQSPSADLRPYIDLRHDRRFVLADMPVGSWRMGRHLLIYLPMGMRARGRNR